MTPRSLFLALLFLIAHSSVAQSYVVSGAAAATDGERVGVVWSASGDIRAALVPAITQRLENTVSLGPGILPAIAYGDGVYYVVWLRGGRELMLERFTRTGERIDEQPVVIAPEAGGAEIAVDANRHGAVVALFGGHYTLHTTIIPPSGTAFETSEPLYTTTNRPHEIQVGWSGARFLLSWRQPLATCSHCLATSDPLGVFFDAEGHRVSEVFKLPAMGNEMAAGGGNYLLVQSGGGTSSLVFFDSGSASPKHVLWWRTYAPLKAAWDGSGFFLLIDNYGTHIAADGSPREADGSQPGPQVLPDGFHPAALVKTARGFVAVCDTESGGAPMMVLLTGHPRRRATR